MFYLNESGKECCDGQFEDDIFKVFEKKKERKRKKLAFKCASPQISLQLFNLNRPQ